MGFVIVDSKEWLKMCRLCGRKDQSVRCNNAECFDDIIENGHCRDKKGNAVAPIDDCVTHGFTCGCELHDECACKDHGG